MTAKPDLVVVGGGPAGCAAAVMAASVGMVVTLIDPAEQLGGTLWNIPAVQNVLGGHRTGPDLAKAIIGDVADTQTEVVRATVTRVHATDDAVVVDIDNGMTISTPHVVIATGVRAAQPDDVDWLTVAPGTQLPPLWGADPATAVGRAWQILGADRPLGTFLRANPDLDVRLSVIYPPADEYKIHEIIDDPRVTLTRVGRYDLATTGQASDKDVRPSVFANLGVVPAGIDGVHRGPDGYCPLDIQHPRVHIAGDLRSARGQRIQTAMGTGAEAALTAYYARRET
jgi:alkyl hydroperoxide reductase subunit AhpF